VTHRDFIEATIVAFVKIMVAHHDSDNPTANSNMHGCLSRIDHLSIQIL